jgi:hypothetical protein
VDNDGTLRSIRIDQTHPGKPTQRTLESHVHGEALWPTPGLAGAE